MNRRIANSAQLHSLHHAVVIIVESVCTGNLVTHILSCSHPFAGGGLFCDRCSARRTLANSVAFIQADKSSHGSDLKKIPSSKSVRLCSNCFSQLDPQAAAAEGVLALQSLHAMSPLTPATAPPASPQLSSSSADQPVPPLDRTDSDYSFLRPESSAPKTLQQIKLESDYNQRLAKQRKRWKEFFDRRSIITDNQGLSLSSSSFAALFLFWVWQTRELIFLHLARFFGGSLEQL